MCIFSCSCRRSNYGARVISLCLDCFHVPSHGMGKRSRVEHSDAVVSDNCGIKKFFGAQSVSSVDDDDDKPLSEFAAKNMDDLTVAQAPMSKEKIEEFFGLMDGEGIDTSLVTAMGLLPAEAAATSTTPGDFAPSLEVTGYDADDHEYAYDEDEVATTTDPYADVEEDEVPPGQVGYVDQLRHVMPDLDEECDEWEWIEPPGSDGIHGGSEAICDDMEIPNIEALCKRKIKCCRVKSTRKIPVN